MELDSKEWNLTNSQDTILSDSNNHVELNKHKHPEELEAVTAKRQKLSADNENLECIRNICEAVLEDGASLPSALPTEQSDVKPNVPTPTPKKKKTKKKKVPGEVTDDKSKVVKPKNEKSKAHMRKNIRDILKGDELEAETRAAQQREIERVQRLQQQQQQIAECSYVPSFTEDEDNTPASTLVEDLQALAKELEDSSLSPELPLDFLENNQHFEQNSSCSPPANTVNKVLFSTCTHTSKISRICFRNVLFM